MKRRILLACLLVATLVPLGGCPPANPNLSPAGHIAAADLQVIKAIDVLRDAAINLNAQQPPALATATVRKVVNFHESTVKVIQVTPNGWKPAVLAALAQLQTDVPASEWARIQPYVQLVQTLINGVA